MCLIDPETAALKKAAYMSADLADEVGKIRTAYFEIRQPNCFDESRVIVVQFDRIPMVRRMLSKVFALLLRLTADAPPVSPWAR
jgi:hypothetical protein